MNDNTSLLKLNEITSLFIVIFMLIWNNSDIRHILFWREWFTIIKTILFNRVKLLQVLIVMYWKLLCVILIVFNRVSPCFWFNVVAYPWIYYITSRLKFISGIININFIPLFCKKSLSGLKNLPLADISLTCLRSRLLNIEGLPSVLNPLNKLISEKCKFLPRCYDYRLSSSSI